MNIQLNKKTLDIALLCVCAILVFGFKHSNLGLGLAFAALCGIIATESWYKKITNKIDNWVGRHKWFRRIYSALLCFFLVANSLPDVIYPYNFLRVALGAIATILTVGIYFMAEKKNQNSLPRLLTYVVLTVIITMVGVVQRVESGLFVMCVLLLAAGGTMLYNIKKNK